MHRLPALPSVPVESCGILEDAAEKAETVPDNLGR